MSLKFCYFKLLLYIFFTEVTLVTINYQPYSTHLNLNLNYSNVQNSSFYYNFVIPVPRYAPIEAAPSKQNKKEEVESNKEPTPAPELSLKNCNTTEGCMNDEEPSSLKLIENDFINGTDTNNSEMKDEAQGNKDNFDNLTLIISSAIFVGIFVIIGGMLVVIIRKLKRDNVPEPAYDDYEPPYN